MVMRTLWLVLAAWAVAVGGMTIIEVWASETSLGAMRATGGGSAGVIIPYVMLRALGEAVQPGTPRERVPRHPL